MEELVQRNNRNYLSLKSLSYSKQTWIFYIHMYAVQDRNIYFYLFPKIYIHFLIMLINKSCFLGSLLFINLHLESSPSSLLFSLYTKN